MWHVNASLHDSFSQDVDMHMPVTLCHATGLVSLKFGVVWIVLNFTVAIVMFVGCALLLYK